MEYIYIFSIIKLFFLFSCLAVFYASKTLHSVFMLIISFVLGASICILLEAYFVGFLLVIVYVGAIAVLFLFVLMLINFVDTDDTAFLVFIRRSFILSSVFLVLVFAVFSNKTVCFYGLSSTFQSFELLNFFVSQPNTVLIGQLIYTIYFVPFIITSFILLVAMMGAILLAYLPERATAYKQDITEQTSVSPSKAIILKKPIIKIVPNKLLKTYKMRVNDKNVSFLTDYISVNFSSLHINFSWFLVCSVFFPFISFVFIFFFGSWLGDKGVSIFCILITFVSWVFVTVYLFFLVFIFFFSNLNFFFVEFIFGSWFSLQDFTVYWGFYFDPLSIIMLFTVLFITLVVQIYCIDYMWADPFFSKFYAYLSLFSFFMLFLVSSNNYLQVFFGWEGVGLASFLLISFWNTRKDAVTAGIKAMLVNRVGDLFFLFSLIIISSSYKTLNFSDLFAAVSLFSDLEINLFSFSIVLASMAKSAQLGLHTWLPDAMEGPTPVSALIHAATMVTAGVFVIIRSSPIIVHSSFSMEFMCFIGGLTAIFGSSVAAVQVDIKKIVAYSTCSQLGYMFLACGCANFAGAFFHLFTHAFFKALLFLSAGSVIHAVSNEQDIRKMGGLFKFLPFTYVCIFFGSLSLTGFPLFSGFYSKDFILEYAYLSGTLFSFVGFLLGVASIFFTSYYSFRLLFFVFFAPYSGLRVTADKISDAPVFMFVSMNLLLVPAAFFGFLFSEFFIGRFSNFIWADSILNASNLFFQGDIFQIETWVKVLPFFVSFSGFSVSYVINYMGFDFFLFKGFFYKCYIFLARKWYFDDLYNFVIINFMQYIYKYFWLTIERGFLIKFGPAFFKNIPGFIINILTDVYARAFFKIPFYLFAVSFSWLIIAILYWYFGRAVAGYFLFFSIFVVFLYEFIYVNRKPRSRSPGSNPASEN